MIYIPKETKNYKFPEYLPPLGGQIKPLNIFRRKSGDIC